MATLIGNINPRVNRLKIKFLPRNSSRAKTKATIAQMMTVPVVVEIITMRLFFIMPQKAGVVKMLMILSHWGGLGIS